MEGVESRTAEASPKVDSKKGTSDGAEGKPWSKCRASKLPADHFAAVTNPFSRRPDFPSMRAIQGIAFPSVSISSTTISYICLRLCWCFFGKSQLTLSIVKYIALVWASLDDERLRTHSRSKALQNRCSQHQAHSKVGHDWPWPRSHGQNNDR